MILVKQKCLVCNITGHVSDFEMQMQPGNIVLSYCKRCFSKHKGATNRTFTCGYCSKQDTGYGHTAHILDVKPGSEICDTCNALEVQQRIDAHFNAQG